MRLLVLTTLFPNAAMPSHGVFVENRLRAFQAQTGAEIRVIAPVPWFPSQNERFGSWAKWAQAPEREVRHGIEITHPRYFLPPKIGMSYAPIALTRCFEKHARQIINEGWDFDIVDAHYYYPDGVAAVRVAQKLGKPVSVTARGTDINLIPNWARQRAMILEASAQTNLTITVANALKTEIIRLGATPEKIHTLRNGVDLELFHPPQDREKLRASLGLKGPVLASIGHLIDRKGHDLAISALADLNKSQKEGAPKNATLLIAGQGPLRGMLEKHAQKCGVANQVRFLGRIDHEKLTDIYGAADMLVLASSREGWPNVLLESMASGTPCIAAPIWGCGEVIGAPEAGRLAAGRTAPAIADAIIECWENLPERSQTRLYAEQFSWLETAERTHKLYKDVIDRHKNRVSVPSRPAIITSPAYSPKAIITVDTEEQFDWETYTPDGYSICDPADIGRFQALCESFDMEPFYFLTQPLMDDPATAAYFRNVYNQGRGALGLHLHQWVTGGTATPPEQSAFYSFQKNLPASLHNEKLRTLGDAFEKAFGHRAQFHRAGRYGLAPENYALLAKHGITHDFSPSAGFDFQSEGGPDFSDMANDPFIIGAPNDEVTVVPVCGAHAFRHTRIFTKASDHIGFNDRKSHMNSIATLVPRIAMRLSPEGATARDLSSMLAHLVRVKTPIITFTLHSTTLTPGANSYAPTAGAVDRVLETSESILRQFTQRHGGTVLNAKSLTQVLPVRTPSKQSS